MNTPSSQKAGGNPSRSTIFSLSVENEQDGAGRDGRTCLERPNSQARMTGEKNMFPAQLTTIRIGNLTRLIHTLWKIAIMYRWKIYHFHAFGSVKIWAGDIVIAFKGV